jgi:hypothetical protein
LVSGSLCKLFRSSNLHKFDTNRIKIRLYRYD